jgi:hypothetical protein
MEAAVATAMDAGEGPAGVARSVMQQYDEVGQTRALVIARSESARAFTRGQEQAWKDTDVVAGKRWLLAPDACAFCAQFYAEYGNRVVPIGEPFAPIGTSISADGQTMVLDYEDIETPPLHPNCRCDMVAVMTSEVAA